MVSCYFIFTSTKLFIYLNYVNFADKQLSREEKKTFSLLKSHIGNVKRYREQTSHLIEWARQLKKLTHSVTFLLRKTLLNKTSSILSKMLIVRNIGLDLQLIKSIFPALYLRVNKEGYVGKKYVRKGPHNIHFIKHTI